MSNTFGIKQSFRSQSIARKFARTPSSSPSDLSSNESKEQNVFESGNKTFASNVLNRRLNSNGNLNGHVQISSLNSLNNSTSLTSLTELNNSPSNESNESNDKTDYRRTVSARLLHMKNYNKAVTRSADHM
jgi:hypothetical protein